MKTQDMSKWYENIEDPMLRERMVARQKDKRNMTKEQMEAREKKISQQWEIMASKYENMKLSKEQQQVLKGARMLYNCIKKSLTLKNKYDISERRTMSYGGEFFPHTLKENKIAMAWIEKVGDNQEELQRLFPNMFNERIPLKQVCRKPVSIIDGTKWQNTGEFYPVLTMLSYLMHCEEDWGCDGLISVNVNELTKTIDVETTRYNMSAKINSDMNKPYNHILIIPKKHIWEQINPRYSEM